MKPIKAGNSQHHLFSYYEIRKNLIKIFGEPKSSDDHLWLHGEIRKIKLKMPKYNLDEKFHKELHKKDCPFLNINCPMV